jgi:hypothetical protein
LAILLFEEQPFLDEIPLEMTKRERERWGKVCLNRNWTGKSERSRYPRKLAIALRIASLWQTEIPAQSSWSQELQSSYRSELNVSERKLRNRSEAQKKQMRYNCYSYILGIFDRSFAFLRFRSYFQNKNPFTDRSQSTSVGVNDRFKTVALVRIGRSQMENRMSEKDPKGER